MVYIALLHEKDDRHQDIHKPTNINPLNRRQLRLMLCPNTDHNVRNPILVARIKKQKCLQKKMLKDSNPKETYIKLLRLVLL